MSTPGEFDTRHLPTPGTGMSKSTGAPRHGFSRPSITLSGGASVKREWRWRTPQQIRVGDIVADVGKVIDVSLVAGSYYVSTTTGSKVLPDRCWAFVEVGGDE